VNRNINTAQLKQFALLELQPLLDPADWNALQRPGELDRSLQLNAMLTAQEAGSRSGSAAVMLLMAVKRYETLSLQKHETQPGYFFNLVDLLLRAKELLKHIPEGERREELAAMLSHVGDT
jgi:hypothetical protein